jgi:hypothetical protein
MSLYNAKIMVAFRRYVPFKIRMGIALAIWAFLFLPMYILHGAWVGIKDGYDEARDLIRDMGEWS